MNTLYKPNFRQTERQLTVQLHELLDHVSVFGPWTFRSAPSDTSGLFDVVASASMRQAVKIELWIAIKASTRPANFPPSGFGPDTLPSTATCRRVPILGAPVVSPRMADVCGKNGWGWFDLAGNCRIEVQGHLHLERTGNVARGRIPRPDANLGTPEASRLLRAILLPRHQCIFMTQRLLQESCRPGVSLGLVNKVLRHLREENYIRRDERGAWRTIDAAGLLEAWRKAYQFKRVRQIRLFTLKRHGEIEQALKNIGPHGDVKVAWGAFSAAEIQAPSVRQNRHWLVVSPDWEEEVRKALDARDVDSGENLVLLIPPDEGPFYEPDIRKPGIPCTNALQTYLDVSQFAGRGEEAAAALLQQDILPAWKEVGVS